MIINTHQTAQLLLANQCLAEYAFGLFKVVHRQVNVSQTVERHQAVLLHRLAFLFLIPHTQHQRIHMVARSIFKHTQSAVVGADVVEGLNHACGVAYGLCQMQLLRMQSDGEVKKAVLSGILSAVAQLLYPLPNLLIPCISGTVCSTSINHENH